MKFEPKTITYYEFMDMWRYIEEKYKIDLYNVKGKSYLPGAPKVEYCDFWHWLLDYWDGYFEKGKPLEINWEDVLGYVEQREEWYTVEQPQWVIDCVKLFHAEFAELGEHTIIVDW
jgi:hypothetical protein